MRIVRCENMDEWNECVSASPIATVFHQKEWLMAIEKSCRCELIPLVGVMDGNVVGICPLFRMRKGPVCAVFSPPPKTCVPFMGPAVIPVDSEGHGMEMLRIKFLEKIDDYISKELRADLISLHFTPGFHDVRALKWRGYTADTLYTYVVDTRDADMIWAGFRSELRRDIRKASQNRIREGDNYGWLYTLVEQRYREQGLKPPISRDYYDSVCRTLGGAALKLFVAEQKGERKSGLLLAHDAHTAYFWFGAPRVDGTTVNDLLHWEAIRWCCKMGIGRYDMVGANTPRLCRYKMKFNPEIAVYLHLKKAGAIGKLAEKAYRKLTGR